jgi:(p)ppGpp synthase/HD superfamily hydrolase
MRIPHATKDDLLVAIGGVNLRDNDKVLLALEQAEMCHEKQERDDGSSYLEQHIFPVTILVIELAKDMDIPITEKLIVASLLHDAMEDDDAFTEQVVELKFGEEILDILLPLTKKPLSEYKGDTDEEKKKDRNKYYLDGILKSPLESRIIKVADRLSNLMCLPVCIDLEKKRYMIKETKEYYLPLAEMVCNKASEEMKILLDRYNRLDKQIR